MGGLGFAGLLLGLLGASLVRQSERRGFPYIFLLMYGLHFLATVVFWRVTLTQGSDSLNYYHDNLGMSRSSEWVGTHFVMKATQFLKTSLGGSLFDCFVLYHAIGLFGVVLLVRVLDEVGDELRNPRRDWAYYLLCLPGLHFWTCAIGKDAPTFLGCCVATWSVLSIRRRFPIYGLAMGLIYLHRPHVALISMVALVICIVVDRHESIATRVILGVVALGLSVMLAGAVQEYLNVQDLSVSGVTGYLESKAEVSGLATSSDESIRNAAYPVKVLSLLIRPLFFDAGGGLGLVVSLENTVWLGILLFAGVFWKDFLYVIRKDMFLRYNAVFFVTFIALLAVLNYNVGLGVRQRTAALPSLLILFFSVRRYRQLQASYARVPVAGPQAA